MASTERDLTVHQRNLVDTCFEEGQYEAAISVLDDFRSPEIKPFPPHVRQLIYIALYPPTSIEEQCQEEPMKLEPGSPSKLLSRRHKSSLTPTPKASSAAHDLLMKFSRTNTPESLGSAFPAFPENPNSHLINRAEEEDSYIAQQALRIRNARCCWEFLKEGFIQRDDVDVASRSTRKGRSRRSTRTHDHNDDAWEDGDSATPAPVSDYAWGVLSWLVTVFETNEASVDRTGQVRYSPLLLGQLPPSRAHNAPRWDVDMPLDVAFHALQQESVAQRSQGVRLLSLLINLTSTILLDFPMFLNAVSTRVSSLSIDTLSYLFASLPMTRTATQFRISLCKHALGGSQTTIASGTKPKPQVRARALPRRRTRTGDLPTDADAMMEEACPPSTHPAQGAVGANSPSVARTYTAIPASEVLALLSRPSKSDSPSVLVALFLKSELVLSYALLQRELQDNDRDVVWQEMIRDGSLQKAVDDVFNPARITDAENRELMQKRKAAITVIISTLCYDRTANHI